VSASLAIDRLSRESFDGFSALSGSAEGLGSRVYRVARLCGAGVSPQVMAPVEDP
jgi:hypothetical protein